MQCSRDVVICPDTSLEDAKKEVRSPYLELFCPMPSFTCFLRCLLTASKALLAHTYVKKVSVFPTVSPGKQRTLPFSTRPPQTLAVPRCLLCSVSKWVGWTLQQGFPCLRRQPGLLLQLHYLVLRESAATFPIHFGFFIQKRLFTFFSDTEVVA